MEGYVIFGVITAVMLLIVFLFYTYKNWLPLRKNIFYPHMLASLLLSVLLEVSYCVLAQGGMRESRGFAVMILRILVELCRILFLSFFLLYDMAIVKKLTLRKNPFFCIFVVLLVVSGVLRVLQRVAMYFGIWSQQFEMLRKCWDIPVLWIFLLAGSVLLYKNKEELTQREFAVMQALHGIYAVMSFAETLLPEGNPMGYLAKAAILIFYYLLLHTSDQYISFSSFCFDWNGFQKVLGECETYRTNFSYLGITINNFESITSICSEEEIRQLHRRLGKILRRICGRHSVYQIHSFEYAVLLSSPEAAAQKHALLETALPEYIRLNGKNVSLLCGFYSVLFSDVLYDVEDLNRTITSMRRLSLVQTERDALLRYSGQNRQSIMSGLEDLIEVNRCVAENGFDFDVSVIQSAQEEQSSCEFILCRHMPQGTDLSQERLWEIAQQSGDLTRLGAVAVEMLCREIRVNGWLDRPFRRFHLNLLASQLESRELVESYIQMFEKYGIPGERLCIECTFRMQSDDKKVTECLLLLKQYGILLVLDQLGTAVCNLKNVLNMPFDGVKISHHMTKTFYEGKSHQLFYLTRMLRKRGWEIILDGISDWSVVDFLSSRDIHFSFVQGLFVQQRCVKEGTI